MAAQRRRTARQRAGVVIASVLGAAAAHGLTTVSALGSTCTWTGLGADDNWGTLQNWSANSPPNPLGGDDVVIDAGPQSTSTLSVPYIINGLTYANTATTIEIKGSALTIGAGGVADIATVPEKISTPVNWSQNQFINVISDTLTLTNDLTGAGGLTKAGTGTLEVKNVRTASLNVGVGRLIVTENGQASGVCHVGALDVGANAWLDLRDNKIITSSAVGFVSGQTYTNVTGLIQRGYNGFGWGGTGIITSDTDATTGSYTSIGVQQAKEGRVKPNPLYTVGGMQPQYIPVTDTDTFTWAGQQVSGSDTLVMYTYGGDSTLDGKIDISDYALGISSGIAAGASGWYLGDYNYDGKINIDDYVTFIDSNVGNQQAPFYTAPGLDGPDAVAVPEPSAWSLVLMVLAAPALVRRQQRCGIESE